MAGACALGELVQTPDEEGREIYLTMCASCHGEDGKGGGPAAAALCKPPPDITRIAQRNLRYTPEFVIDVISGKEAIAAHGSREMPVWGERFGEDSSLSKAVAETFFHRRLEILADYLERIQEPVR